MSPTWKSLHPAFRIFAIWQAQAIASTLHGDISAKDCFDLEAAFIMGDEL